MPQLEDRRESRWLIFSRLGGIDRTTVGHMARSFCLVIAFLLTPAICSSSPLATLEDLKKLEITCFVPSYLPRGFRLKKIEISYDEIQEYEDKNRPLPLYSVEYEGPSQGGIKETFSIESAREGIGDRNLMEEDDAEETAIDSPLGKMYLIYRPKGKTGRKIAIVANWQSDANMNMEKAKDTMAHPVLGRYHGFSATGITMSEFTKIIKSLHALRPGGG